MVPATPTWGLQPAGVDGTHLGLSTSWWDHAGAACTWTDPACPCTDCRLGCCSQDHLASPDLTTVRLH